MPPVEDLVGALSTIFRATDDKRQAHRVAWPVLEQASRNPQFLREVLRRHVVTPGALATKNYPVVTLPVARTPYFELVLNCWIPLPDKSTDLSTKSIHHHGPLLLSTATIFGPGYEHWLFGTPKLIDRSRDLYSMDVLEAAAHPLHHIGFVDTDVPHLPMYPRDLSITLAMWSNSKPTSWRDHVKQVPAIKKNAALLRNVTDRLGLRKSLDLKIVEYYDFYPTAEGFRGMRDRQEFVRGSNEDYLDSLFSVLQATGNSALGDLVRANLAHGSAHSEGVARAHLEARLADLAADRPIAGTLSPGHYDLPHANFSSNAIRAAHRALPSEKQNARELTAATAS